MIKSFLFTVLLAALALGLLACEIPAESSPESSPAIPAADAVEPTVEVTTVHVTGAVVNLRAGPSVAYAVLGQVQADDSLPVTGINADRTWLQVAPEGEIRWIFADLTDVSAEQRGTLAEVAAPALGESLATSEGQTESAAPATATPEAAAVAPTATPPVVIAGSDVYPPGTLWKPPGSYGRHLLGLDYDFEIEWVDRSAQWDWELKDHGGCYDALRVFMGSVPKQYGLKKYQIALTDPGETLDIEYYYRTPNLLLAHTAEPRAALRPLAPSWPNWEGKLVAEQAATGTICYADQLHNGLVPCELQVWWGEPSHNLDGAAIQSLAASMGGTLFIPSAGGAAGAAWVPPAVSKRKQYLAPFYGGTPTGPNVCFSVKRQE